MLDANPNAPNELRARIRERNQHVWATGMLTGSELAPDEATLNSLYLSTIEAPIAITDEVMAVKEYERDREFYFSSQQMDLETQAILDGFDFVLSKLIDMEALWQVKDDIERTKDKSALDLAQKTSDLLNAEEALEDLQTTAMLNDVEVLGYDKDQTANELIQEDLLKIDVIKSKATLHDVQAAARVALSTARKDAEAAVNQAKRATFGSLWRNHNTALTKVLKIGGERQ